MKSQYESGPAGEDDVRPLRIVLACYGSLGDLHPSIALAEELQRRGHLPLIASVAQHRERVERLGLPFESISPDMPVDENSAEYARFMREVMNGRRGSEHVIRRVMMPAVRDQYRDLEAVVRQGVDLLVSHPITFAAPLVAAKHGIPWAGTALAPLVFLSQHDLPIPPEAGWVEYVRRLGPAAAAPFVGIIRLVSQGWCRELESLRRELKLPERGHSIFDAQFSPALNLALFSRFLADPQPDWPANTIVTGFPFSDGQPKAELPVELERFLAAGEPPLVFTLGSSAVRVGGDFFLHSIDAARRLNRRALLLAGSAGWNRLPASLPETVYVADYLPHSQVFPHASAIVHQGGVGTTGQAMRAGKPMLVVPYSHDQDDNGARLVRKGVARVLPRSRYRSDTAARELAALLGDGSVAARAARMGETVRAERGAAEASDRLLGLAGGRPVQE